jgi:acyl transferase domain-containing protein/phosphopantetheinyl transferase
MSRPGPAPDVQDDIAVVGLACLYPGAPDLGAFWRNIVGKRSAITDPPPEAWDEHQYYDVGSDENDRVYCKKGGYLGPLAYFDPLDHGIMPRAVEGGEPDQWLALHVARQALRDAGYAEGGPGTRRTALILGKGTYANRGTISVVQHGVVIDYTLKLLQAIHPELTAEDLLLVRRDLKQRLPRFDAETAPALIPNVTVGRIANRLDLTGPSYTVDAACASSLVSVDIAVKGLRHGEYDVALVGGMQVATPLPVLSLFCRLKALSPTERIRPFDKDADGTLLSEGIGMAVLKRRPDAEHDGDRIYAFVKGSGVASDGRAVSVLAPSVEGEELALRLAYEAAAVEPPTVGLIEAHGTATLVGDAVEVEALGRVFGERRGRPRCALGSVKSMIGHTMPAAGMAGFIKAALALYHRVLPPTLNVAEPSPRLKLDATPFYINTEPRPWIHGGRDHPRRAGVNAFGFGGINGHVVLEEAPGTAGRQSLESEWETEAVVLGGPSRAEVAALGERVLAAAARVPAPRLADLAFSVNARSAACEGAGVVLGIVAGSVEDLALKLARALPRLGDPACARIKDVGGIYFFQEPLARQGGLAFLFPGEGAQHVNMLADLCRHFPEVRACFDEMDRLFAGDSRGYVLSDLVFPPPSFSERDREEAERRLWQMDAAVEALYTANHAVYGLLSELGLRPDAMLGHSTGEYSALRAAGMLNPERYEARLREVNRIYEGAAADGRVPAPAKLLAIGATREQVERACGPFGADVCVAMDNCPHQIVLVVRVEAAARLEESLRAQGLLYEVLPFDRPYHTPAFEEYARELKGFLHDLIARPPQTPLYSATSTGRFPGDLDGVRRLAYEHWMRPVEFRRTIERMHADGIRLFVESGPRGNLTAFVDDILRGRSYAAIPANVSRRSGITQLNHLITQLSAHGVRLTLAPLYRSRHVQGIDLDRVPSAEGLRRPLGRVKIPTGTPEMRLSPEIAERIRARVRQGSPAPVAVPSKPGDAALSPGPPPPAAARGPGDVVGGNASPATEGARSVMSAFLGTMQRFLAIQEDLMARTLSQGAAVEAGGEAGETGGGPEPATDLSRRLPFIDTVLTHVRGRELAALCSLGLERCPALKHHTLGRGVSADDPALPGLPVVPFTLMMEIMAEAGTALAPGRVVAEMREVRVYRWVGLDLGPVTFEIRAQHEGDGRVSVRLLEAGAEGGAAIAEGVIVLGESYPPAPAAAPLQLPDAQPYRWPPDRLYDEAMFHGPSFRGVRSVDRVGKAGAEASLVVLDRSGLLDGGRAAGLVTDFVLLDLPGQVVGFWASQLLDRGHLVLPYYMKSLKVYAPPLPPGTPLRCDVRVARVGDQHMVSDLDVVGADGLVRARFEGWEDRRFDLPAPASQMLVRPEAVTLSRGWPAPAGAPGLERLVARRLGPDAFPEGWLVAHGGLWMRVLAAVVLSRREREAWRALPPHPRRRLEWLLGRIAAKDAVRVYMARQHGLTLCPADVELLPDAHGRPTVGGAWAGRFPRVPRVSISHVHGVAVAVAGEGHHLLGVGVDLERLGRMAGETPSVAFTADELRMLDAVEAQEREAWSLRFWCAKEACAKATGRGFAAGPNAFTVRAMDREGGLVSVRFAPPERGPRDFVAVTAQDGDWIVATCATTAEEGVQA